MTDPAGQTRTLNDLERRRTDFTGIVCGPSTPGPLRRRRPPPKQALCPRKAGRREWSVDASIAIP